MASFELNWKTVDDRSGSNEVPEVTGKTARLASVDNVSAAVAVEPRFQQTFQVPIDVTIGHIPKIRENTRTGNNVDIYIVSILLLKRIYSVNITKQNNESNF